MTDPFDDQKKRPPPIYIPPVPRHIPATHASQMRNTGHQQRDARNVSSSIQQDPRFATSPLTSPLEHDASRLPLPQSGSQKSRASAMTTLTTLMEQARASPRKSENDSTNARSTTRSRHSERSHHSAVATQSQFGAIGEDERTSRGKIESRTEKAMFKMTGQLPPTPIANSVSKDEVLIVTQDLREQCRAVGEEKKAEQPEPVKSPKKKIFGMNLPTFGRTSSNAPTPPMPSKAAQILGQEPRNPTKVVVRPIKPAGPFKTPTKAPRSDTSKSLPAKLLNQDTYARSHHRATTRRHRTTSRKSPPRASRESSDAENRPPVPAINSSFESGPPPTPPAKDTPPDSRSVAQPPSPLRRAPPSDRLHESYVANVDDGARLQFPTFALSPSPSKPPNTEAGKSPTKYLQCTADEYQRLIGGEPLPWVSLAKGGSEYEQENDQEHPKHLAQQGRWSYDEQQDGHSASLVGENIASLQLPRLGRWSEEQHHSDRSSRRYSPLPPRFYSPSNRSVQLFAEGETPSKNSDTGRLLCTVTSRADLFHFREESNNGSIEMIFQGDANDIDPQSSTGHLLNNSKQETMLVQTRNDSALNARVMQEPRIGEQQEQSPHQPGATGHLLPDQSSSRLTDILHGVSPRRGGFKGEFHPNCPSAVPSPLHKIPGPITPVMIPAIVRESSGPFGPPRTPKTIEDHFYMTNEHLDVVGKSNWDQIEALKKEQLETFNNRHAQLVTTVEKYMQEIKMQVDSVNEKADRTTEQSHNIDTKLEKLFDFIKNDVMGALTAQDKKSTTTEQILKELQKTVQTMQKTLDQRQSEPKPGQQNPTAAPTPTPNTTTSPFPLPAHRSQPSLAGYYGNMTESGREGQPPIPVMQDHRNSVHVQDAHSDPRAGYGNNYGQQWGTRGGYHARGGKEDRPYSGTNPYHFANGGGQFSNGYGGGYSAYNFSPSPPEQHYGFNQGPPK